MGVECSHGEFGNSVTSVVFIGRHSRVRATDINSRALRQLHAQHVMHGDRLICGPQFVETVRTKRTDAQAEIDLGERPNRDRHGGMIVLRSRRIRGKSVAKSRSAACSKSRTRIPNLAGTIQQPCADAQPAGWARAEDNPAPANRSNQHPGKATGGRWKSHRQKRPREIRFCTSRRRGRVRWPVYGLPRRPAKFHRAPRTPPASTPDPETPPILPPATQSHDPRSGRHQKPPTTYRPASEW